MTKSVVTGSADIFTSGSITMDEVFAFLDTEPVGTVKESILSEAQFQARAGDGWVRADGRSLSTTTYAELFGFISYTYGGSGGSFNIPNMQNRYSRMSGASAVGTFQSYATKKNGLTLAGGVAALQGGGICCLPNPNHNHCPGTYRFPFTTVKSTRNTYRNFNVSTTTDSICLVTNFRPGGGIVQGNTTTQQGLQTYGCTSSGSSDVAYLNVVPICVLSTATETRPESIVLNWFVRVK